MADLRLAAEALLQTAQLHQRNFETIATELQTFRAGLERSDRLHQESARLHRESAERFEILLAELRQLRIESEARLNGQQTEIRRLIDRLFNQRNEDET